MTLEFQNLALPLGSFSLEIDQPFKGGIIGISGASGSGKTSFLETVAGLRRPSRGRLLMNASVLCDVAASAFLPAWQRRIGYVPQEPSLFPHWSVRQNLMCSLRFRRGKPDPERSETVIGLLELRPMLDRGTSNLSGGEQARVSLGRALLGEPELLLLDEPMAHLDDRLRAAALDWLRETSRTLSLPMILVSHSASELRAVCSQVHQLHHGRFVQADP